jgi:hypothetical protein
MESWRACKICGERKGPLEFVKLKHFHTYHPSSVNWCKGCQKMYMEMKKEEKRKDEFLAVPFVAQVHFN